MHAASRSPSPARLSSGGAWASTSRSISSRSGQRVAVVRLTPETSSTDWSSEKPLTLAAVCTTTCGMPPRSALIALPMSATVPEPMLTITAQPAQASIARRSVAASAHTWSPSSVTTRSVIPAPRSAVAAVTLTSPCGPAIS